tara:strand:- start:2605 stop:3156 length:552 start_codon:yes stop_codon:yes gene_type:complete
MDPKIDTMFFSNFKSVKTSNINKENEKYSAEDFKLYKREIYKTFKHLNNGKIQDNNLCESYDTFIKETIEYLKFKNKVKQIQREHKSSDDNIDIDFSEPKECETYNYDKINEMMYKEKDENKNVSMNKFIKKNNNIKDVIKFPKQREYKKGNKIDKEIDVNKKNTVVKREKNSKKHKTMKIEI